jgi:hypothetical protein
MSDKNDFRVVNEKEKYLEEFQGEKSRPQILEQVIAETFSRIDKSAFGIATGCVSGLIVFLATLWLVIKGGPVASADLDFLGQYFFGYTVTVTGALWGFGHGFLWGFLFGGLFAYFHNFAMAVYLLWVKRKSEFISFRDFLDHM